MEESYSQKGPLGWLSIQTTKLRPLSLGKDIRRTWRETTRFLNSNRWACLVALGIPLMIALITAPRDPLILESIRGATQPESLNQLARNLGKWGDFAQFNLLISIGLWLTGYVGRSRWLQRLAFATLFAAILAGLTCNIFRATLARPRPSTNVADGLYGFQGTFKGHKYHGFPSGHTSTACGSGVPIVTAGGIWGIPVAAFSTSVGWARMYQNKHYPTDVLIGATLGGIFGIATSWRLRKIRLRLKRRKASSNSMKLVTKKRSLRLFPLRRRLSSAKGCQPSPADG